jgi:hypothetical protein
MLKFFYGFRGGGGGGGGGPENKKKKKVDKKGFIIKYHFTLLE